MYELSIQQLPKAKSIEIPMEWELVMDGTFSGQGPEIIVRNYFSDGDLDVANFGCTHTNRARGDEIVTNQKWRKTRDADLIAALARLACAAPKLLSACRQALQERFGWDDPCTDLDPITNQLREAIEAATGVSVFDQP